MSRTRVTVDGVPTIVFKPLLARLPEDQPPADPQPQPVNDGDKCCTDGIVCCCNVRTCKCACDGCWCN